MKRIMPIAFAGGLFFAIWIFLEKGGCSQRFVVEPTSGTLPLELKYRAWSSEFDVDGAFEVEITNVKDDRFDRCSLGLDSSFARLSYLEPLRNGPIRTDSIGPRKTFVFQFSHDTNNWSEYNVQIRNRLPRVISVRCDGGNIVWKVPKRYLKVAVWSNSGESSNEERLKATRGLILEPNANYVPGAYPMSRGRLEAVLPSRITDENGN